MIKLKKALIFTLVFLISFSSFVFAVSEIEPRTTSAPEDTPTTTSESDIMPINVTEEEAGVEEISTPEIVEHDVFLSGEEIVFDSLVDGNAFLFGSKVTVTGEVNGDLAIFANEVIIEENSYIYSSLYVFANKLILNGVCFDLYAFADTFSMGESSYVYRDLNLFSNNVIINGYVNRNANVRAEAIELNYANGPTIVGDLNYTSPNEITFNDKSVYGTIRFTQEIASEPQPENIFTILQDKALEAIFLLVVFLLASWLTPKFLTRSGEYVSSLKLLHALWIGIVATIVLFVVNIALLFILPKLAVVSSLITFLAFLLATPVFAFAITSAISQKAKVQNYALKVLINILTAVILVALPIIPVIGWIFNVLYYIFGFGMMILYIFDSERRTGTKKAKSQEKKAKQKKVEESKSETKPNTEAKEE